MTRRAVLGLLLGLCACRSGQPLPEVFRDTVGGVWRRTALRDAGPSETPDPIPRTAVRRLRIAEYEGPGKLEARLYDLQSSGVALDLVQRWRPSADTIFFYEKNYFVVVKWRQAERAALQSFVHDVQSSLNPQERGGR
jgi:hypothetical protein